VAVTGLKRDMLSGLPERFEAEQDADIDDLLTWHNSMKANFAML